MGIQHSQNLPYPSSLAMGFDFYGAGNIGDDLMVAGFVQALSILQPNYRIKLYGTSRWNLRSQRLRFPEICWIPRNGTADQKVFNSLDVECWAGVGDTPFQITSGDWFLKFLLSELVTIASFQKKVLINIGAESEIQLKAEDFAPVAKTFDHISTRDEQSTHIIMGLLDNPNRLYSGADLANISLPRILREQQVDKEFRLGIILAGDTLSQSDIKAVGEFIATRTHQVAFIAGETRPGPTFERGIYGRLTRWPWSRISRKAILQVPPYEQGSLFDLVYPICTCETVLSSRYHGILTAAWAGCRVGAIGRSSKVISLADVLKVPFCKPPVTREKLENLQNEASRVPIHILTNLRDKAICGVSFSLDMDQ